jgi:hypothetical protein
VLRNCVHPIVGKQIMDRFSTQPGKTYPPPSN